MTRVRSLLLLLLALAASAVGTSAQDGPLRMVLTVDGEGPTLNRHLYGHFAEHLGNDIYGGLWVRGADGEWGLNEPVIEALRELNPPNVRWPGGCFADYYHWRDGVGPADERPSVVNQIWGGVTEDNSFGTHEYMALVDALDTEPFVVGNVGSGTVEEMADWWEYVNHPGGSPMSDLRAENGREEPWAVRFWGVGNESWGCGGEMRPGYYADLYKRFQTFLRQMGDTRAFRVATGPNVDMYDWTETVMREAGRFIDGLDMHYYTYTGTWWDKGEATDFTEAEWLEALQRAMRMDELITRHSAIMDRHDPENRVWLIVGEWGTWHQVEEGTNPGFLRQQNALRDALVASLTLDIFAEHAERVRMGNIAQTVNVLQAMILTEEDTGRFVRTPTFHVFEMYKVHQDARALPLVLDRGVYAHGGESIPAVSASASRDADGVVHVSMTNTDPNRPRTIEASVRGGAVARVSGRVLTASAMTAHNTFDDPDAVAPVPFTGASVDDGTLTVVLPPKSVVTLRLDPANP